jgi:hypothetical protein
MRVIPPVYGTLHDRAVTSHEADESTRIRLAVQIDEPSARPRPRRGQSGSLPSCWANHRDGSSRQRQGNVHDFVVERLDGYLFRNKSGAVHHVFVIKTAGLDLANHLNVRGTRHLTPHANMHAKCAVLGVNYCMATGLPAGLVSTRETHHTSQCGTMAIARGRGFLPVDVRPGCGRCDSRVLAIMRCFDLDKRVVP